MICMGWPASISIHSSMLFVEGIHACRASRVSSMEYSHVPRLDENFLPVSPRFSTRDSQILHAQHAQAAGAVLSRKFNTSMLSTTMCM